MPGNRIVPVALHEIPLFALASASTSTAAGADVDPFELALREEGDMAPVRRPLGRGAAFAARDRGQRKGVHGPQKEPASAGQSEVAAIR